MADVNENIEALGPISVPVRKLVELVAESATFQTRVKADSVEEAMKFIHHPHLRANGFEEIKGPLAVVSSQPCTWERVDANQLRPTGVLVLTLSNDDKYPEKSDWSQIDFENFCGQVIQDICELQGKNTRLTIDSIVQSIPASLSHPTAAGPDQRSAYWISTFEIHRSQL